MIARIKAFFRERHEGGAAPHGQVLVLFALFLTSLLGMLGLATDLGFAFAERPAPERTVRKSRREMLPAGGGRATPVRIGSKEQGTRILARSGRHRRREA